MSYRFTLTEIKDVASGAKTLTHRQVRMFAQQVFESRLDCTFTQEDVELLRSCSYHYYGVDHRDHAAALANRIQNEIDFRKSKKVKPVDFPTRRIK